MDNGDLYLDHTVTIGASFQWSFDLTPLDLTGCTVSMIVTGLATLAMTVTVTYYGAIPYSRLAVSVLDTSAWAKGIYSYRVLCTFPDGAVFPFGHGKVLAS